MPDFKAKMHQIQFRRCRANSAPPDPLAGLRGPTSKGRGGETGEGVRLGREWRGEEGRREGEGRPPTLETL